MKKSMRLCLATALCMMVGMGASAQSLRYGVTAGVQRSSVKEFGPRMGFHFGPKVEFEFSQNTSRGYVESGLLLSAKGWSEEVMSGSGHETLDWKCRLYYLQMPVWMGYKRDMNERATVFVAGGPYVAVGLSGKTTITGNEEIDTGLLKTTCNNLFSDGVYRRFDFGVGAKVGLEFNRCIQVALGYEAGLIKPLKDWKLNSLKERTVSFTASYLF